MLNKIDANGKSYSIEVVYKKHSDDDDTLFVELKNKFNYDALIKNEQFYFLCNEITDAVFTEIPTNEITEELTKEISEIEKQQETIKE